MAVTVRHSFIRGVFARTVCHFSFLHLICTLPPPPPLPHLCHRNNKIDDLGLGLTFSTTMERFGEQQEVELAPGGKDTDVVDANKAEYVR